MSDLVERLNRNAESWLPTHANTLDAHNLVGLAADRIEQLERVLAQAREALEWSIDQGGGPICEHDSGGAVCFCKENAALSAINEALHGEVSEKR